MGKKYAPLCDPTCCEISMVLIFLWSSSFSAFCSMQYLKHSTTEVTITALSEGLDTARSLERLGQTDSVRILIQLKWII